MAASSFYNRVKYKPASAGTGDFVTSSAVTGFLTPATASVANGTLVSYVAFSSDQSEWETGQGAYTSGTTTLARTTVRESSNAGSKVNFTAAPTIALDFQAQDALNLPSLAIAGATIGTDKLAVTGTANISGILALGAGVQGTSGANYRFGFDVFSSGAFDIRANTTTSVFRSSNVGVKTALEMYYGWSNTAGDASAAIDTNISRNAAGVIQFGTTAANASGSWLATNGTLSGYLAGTEMSAPAAPAADGYRIFAQDNGGGKTQLMVIFSSGAAQQIAIQP